jgi:hypothetical protein
VSPGELISPSSLYTEAYEQANRLQKLLAHYAQETDNDNRLAQVFLFREARAHVATVNGA